MIKELKKYKETGNFIFRRSDKLKVVCNAPNNKAGVYLVYAVNAKIKNLIYIGCSGHIKNDGTISIRKTGLGGIKGRLVNGHQFNRQKRYKCWPLQMELENIDVLEIHWFVTHNLKYIDSPAYVEINLLKKYLDLHKRLPKWNKKL